MTTSLPKIQQSLPLKDWVLIVISLSVLLGGIIYPGARWLTTTARFHQALTEPALYERTFRRPAKEAEAWSLHLGRVMGRSQPLRSRENSLLTMMIACSRSEACSKARQSWQRANPPQPWGGWYYAGILLLAAAPLPFVQGIRKPKAEAPAPGQLASRAFIKARQKELAKTGRKIVYAAPHVDKDATFLGLIGDDAKQTISQEPETFDYLQLPSPIRERHILVVAGTGAGKTSTYAFNQIISSAKNGMGVILIDQKWGDESGLIGAIPIFSYYRRPIYVFAPFSPTTPRLPILEGISTEDTNDAMEFAQMIVPAADDASVQHYRENDWALLAALVIAEIEHAKREERPPDLGRVVELLSLESKDSLESYTQISPVARILAAKIFSRPAAKLDEAIPGLRNKLLPFINPVVRRATTRGKEEENLDLKKILQEPALFYVGVPQTKVKLEDGKVLLRLIKHYIDRAIFSQGHLPVPYNFILDEFANFGFLPNMDHNLALIRSKRVSMHIILQSVEQAVKVYTKEGWEAIARNNFNTEIWYIGDLSAEVQEELAKKLGETTIYTETYNESRSQIIEFIPRRSYGIRASRRNLITKEEMAQAKPGTTVVRLPYVGWSVFRAVPLFDPRNPFYQDWKQVESLTPHFTAAYRSRRLGVKTEDVLPLTAKTAPPTPTERLRAWTKRLLELTAPMKVQKGPQGTPSRVDFVYAPPGALPKEWFEEKLLRLGNNAVYTTAKGLEAIASLLPQIEQVAILRRLLEAAYQRGLIVFFKEGEKPKQTHLGIIDLPSRRVYIPPALEELYAFASPIGQTRPHFLPPGEWREIQGGEMLYGLVAYAENGEREIQLLYAESLVDKQPIPPL